MPETSYMFGLPYEYYEKYHVRRYGAHGTSHRFVAYRTAEIVGKDLKDFKLITCHLGNGCSITAIKDGKVLDTSMGLTPLDGFVMGTRCGAVDPSAITYIMDKENISPKDMDTIMNKKSGVLGISGVHSDDREVKKAASEGNKRAKLARDMQWYQIRKVIGSYIAAMDGVDVIAFTGGIGENCTDLREDVLSNLSYLGIKLNKEVNDATHGDEVELTLPGCPVRAFVVPTNEELAIARDTKEIVEKL
jgi:acetate kinase